MQQEYPKQSIYSSSIRNRALELYNEGLFCKEIGKILDINPGTVQYWCKREGILRHRGPKSKIKNEDYFSVIDTEDKAYWLGWLIADGCVSIYNKQYYLKTGIQLCDKELIYGFMKAIDSENSITVRPMKNKISISLTSRQLVEDLMTLKMIPQKSTREELPEINPILRHHMIRGFFDGDGITCIGKSKRSGFCGSLNVMNFIQNETNLYQKIRPNQNIYYFLLGKKDSAKLYKYMYQDANIFLQRKKDRMDIIVGDTEVIIRPNKLIIP